MARSNRTVALPTVASFDEFKALTSAVQAKMAKAIASDRESGLSGNDLREKYGEWLTGPRRRKIARDHGFGHIVAPSYVAYSDPEGVEPITLGESRKGTRHARLHGTGAQAAARRESVAASMDKADLAKAGRRRARKVAAK